MKGVSKNEVIQFVQESGYEYCDKGGTIKVRGESTTAYEEFSAKFGYEAINTYKRGSQNEIDYANFFDN
ncbi:unnamed protein product [Lupinus luteus]|uniref:Uncharacterized protein n=1 Tax=Lupinus luteus TaxID=3873 RepID=A0AAV1YIE0_LUPLU